MKMDSGLIIGGIGIGTIPMDALLMRFGKCGMVVPGYIITECNPITLSHVVRIDGFFHIGITTHGQFIIWLLSLIQIV